MNFSKYPILVSLLFLLIIVAMGCSGKGTDPVSQDFSSESIDGLAVIDLSESGGVVSSLGLFGAYEISINPDEITAELISKRMTSIGESYIVSGAAFFTIAPCPDCLKIVGISLDADSKAHIKFEIRHPFDPGITSLPPTAINRRDLDVFDLAMVIKPHSAISQTFSETGISIYSETCSGPDGFTTELANLLNDTSAMPYFLCVDDSIDEDPPVSTWNKFAMGAVTTFEVGFNLDDTPLSFDTYLTMGYGFSAVKIDRLSPKYFNPEFNRKSAWKVDVYPPTGTEVGTTWDTLDVFPQDVIVEVFDWQIGATVYSTPDDFGNAPSDNIYSTSEPFQVTVEVPGMSASLPTSNAPDDPSATGKPDDPWVYTIPVPHDNSTPLEPGTYSGLVTVKDSRVPIGAPPDDTRDYLIDVPDGIQINSYDINEYVTYQTFQATVVLGCGPISGDITTPAVCPVTGIFNNSSADFTVTAASDNGGDPVTLFEVDYDYDGITFDVDDSNVSGIFTVGPLTNPNCGTPPEDPVTYTVAFRATDSCSPPNTTVFATCDVTVDSCVDPVGNVSLATHRITTLYGHPFDPTGPWSLSWTAANGAVEYGIYYDSDPSDGLTNNLVSVGETTDTNYTVPASHLPGDHEVPGNTYIVRSRSTIGDPASETAADSEPAHIMTNGWETLDINMNPGWGNDGEGWEAATENNTASYYSIYPYVSTGLQAHGNRMAAISEEIGRTECGNYQGITRQTPTVDDSSVRFLELSVFASGFFTSSSGYEGGAIIGTCQFQPNYPWLTPYDFEWSDASSGGTPIPYFGYNQEENYVTSTFDDVPTAVNNNWDMRSGASYSRLLLGSDVNIEGNPSDEYIGIMACKSGFNWARMPYWYMDEFAILIY